jgi:hypothetical protein
MFGIKRSWKPRLSPRGRFHRRKGQVMPVKFKGPTQAHLEWRRRKDAEQGQLLWERIKGYFQNAITP